MKVKFRIAGSRLRFSRDMSVVPRHGDAVSYDGLRYTVQVVEWHVPIKIGEPTVELLLYRI